MALASALWRARLRFRLVLGGQRGDFLLLKKVKKFK